MGIKMKNLAERIFRNADKMTASTEAGVLEGKGIITACGTEEAKWKPVETGLNSVPLFIYMGDCTGLTEKSIVVCGSESYRVISCRLITGFGRVFCMRAVMEKLDLG